MILFLYSYVYYIYILVIFLLYYIFVKNKYTKFELFELKLLDINKKFLNYLELCKQCKNKLCKVDSVKSNQNKIFEHYSDKDLPGPFPYDYPILENMNNLCKNDTYIFVSIISLCYELEERIAIRKVYQNLNSSIQFHFFIGYTTEECQKEYFIEKSIFKDISQIPIQESYINQTLFTLYLHKILPTICPLAKYYGKMDVDQFINYPKLLTLLFASERINNLIYSCKIWKFLFIPTNQSNKYSSPVNISKYYKKVFPKNGIKGFTGSFTLYPSYISNILYKESLNETHLIRMEDQHIAWLVYKLNMKRMNISYYNLKCHDANIYTNYCSLQYRNEYGIHRIKGANLYSFFNHNKQLGL